MYILTSEHGRFVTPSGGLSDRPDDAALFCAREAAAAVPGPWHIRALVPRRVCPDGQPFGGGLVIEPLTEGAVP